MRHIKTPFGHHCRAPPGHHFQAIQLKPTQFCAREFRTTQIHAFHQAAAPVPKTDKPSTRRAIPRSQIPGARHKNASHNFFLFRNKCARTSQWTLCIEYRIGKMRCMTASQTFITLCIEDNPEHLLACILDGSCSRYDLYQLPGDCSLTSPTRPTPNLVSTKYALSDRNKLQHLIGSAPSKVVIFPISPTEQSLKRYEKRDKLHVTTPTQ